MASAPVSDDAVRRELRRIAECERKRSERFHKRTGQTHDVSDGGRYAARARRIADKVFDGAVLAAARQLAVESGASVEELVALDIVTYLQPINSDHQRRIAKCLFETIMQDVSSTTKHCADFRRAIRRAGGRCSNMAAYGWLNATTAAQYGVPLVQRYVALWAATSSPS